MADSSRPPRTSASPAPAYQVVARRYRPQTFEELVGQEPVARALRQAIQTQRVGHAYLFAGVRGVGKTSAARILAKALNCAQGPTVAPCNACELCQAIAAGDDVDVLEIDGASNRGIDEIRQLRSNAGVRPTRARYKIYIIDEVHMLTPAAFNALLKTLEEPPGHVKFIFCTTDPEKIPVTVLSRCQRFDFAPLSSEAIKQRLQAIAKAEGAKIEPEAVELLARRAAGSMRDSQSLLEQLLAFQSGPIRAADVHALLGTAPTGRVAKLAERVLQRDAAGALREAGRAVEEGVDAGRLAEQLVAYFRDLMAAAVGCGADQMLTLAPEEFEQAAAQAKATGPQTLLAMLELLDESLSRMRYSAHGRTLLEAALVRACQLEQLESLERLIEELRGAGSPASAGRPPGAQKKTRQPIEPSERPAPPVSSGGRPAGETAAPPPAQPEAPRGVRPAGLAAADAERVWREAIGALGDITADYAACYRSVGAPAPDRLVVRFAREYTLHKQFCERPERKARIEAELARVVGAPVRVQFEVVGPAAPAPAQPPRTRRQRLREAQQQPLVQQAMALFDAELVGLETPPEPPGDQRLASRDEPSEASPEEGLSE